VSTPTPIAIANAAQAIAVVQAKYPDVKDVRPTPPGTIGAETDITVIERVNGWDLVFRKGWGDCPAGCINNHYWYFSVSKDSTIEAAGEYERVYDAAKNSFAEKGAPRWGVPK